MCGLACVLALVGGCKERVFMTECDLNHYRDLMPKHLENNPTATNSPTIDPVNNPPTINTPERDIRYISLAECIAIALEQGNIGANQFSPAIGPNGTSPAGITADSPLGFQPGSSTNPFTATDQIRVLSLVPAAVGATIEQALSKFDAVWNSSMSWQNTDRPIGTPLDTFQSGTGVNAIEQTDATFTTGVAKPLPTGGVVGITFNTAYQLTNLPARVNPSYRPALQLQFEQPLLQGFGVEINELRSQHPGSVLGTQTTNPSQPLGTNEGILITRIRFDQRRADFERLVQIMVTNVEFAYWNLYSAYWQVYSSESAMRQAYEAWKISSAKYQAGRVSIADLAQTRGQYELFRVQRIANLDNVIEGERQLRGLLGMPIEDGVRLVPSDAPTLAPYTPDWHGALEEALNLRPELFESRNEVKAAQMNVILAKNFLMPDLRFTSSYDANGIGTRLDGADTNNAFRSLSSDHFNNWSLGLRLFVPIGYRAANAQVRIARLQLAQSYATLHDNELKISRTLALAYRRIPNYYEQIRANRAQREAFGEQLRARFQEFLAGRGTLDLLLEAQRFWAQALAAEYSAIAEYNKSLAYFEYQKGTILHHNSVVIGEGALPNCAMKRAVEHQKERTAALILRERAALNDHSPFKDDGVPFVAKTPESKALSLPSVLEKAPTPQEEGEASKSSAAGSATKLMPNAPAAKPQTPATKEDTKTKPANDIIPPPAEPAPMPTIVPEIDESKAAPAPGPAVKPAATALPSLEVEPLKSSVPESPKSTVPTPSLDLPTISGSPLPPISGK